MAEVKGTGITGTVLTPANLRAYLARYDVAAGEIARRRGVSATAVSSALRADLKDRPVSRQLLRSIFEVASEILLEREEVRALPRAGPAPRGCQ